MTTGMYTTLAQNSGYGTLTTQTTAGVSYAKIGWDGSNYVAYKGKAFGDYTTYIVGIYTTLATADAGDIDEFGTVRKTTTVGDSHKWDPNESEDMVTGAYTTTAQNNGYGTLLTQITVGESYNKVPIADGVYKKYTVGAYTTMATANSNALGKIDGFGTVRETITTGKSYKLDTHADKSEWDVWEDVSGDYTTIGKNIATGSYTTTATNTAAGVLFTQLTVGESYNKIFNGTGYEEYTVGRYTTLASAAENELGNIDGFGTVLKSITIGDSHKRDAITEKDIISGSYTTTAQNNAYGTLETQETIGESYNKVWNGSAYVVDTVGSYTTMTTADENELGFIDGFGTVRESITRGVSFKMDRFANDKMVSGYYSTTAWNNSYGTLMSQQTRGSSYNRLGVDAEGNFTAYNQERFNAGEYTSYSVGEYTTESYYSNTFTDASGQEQREVDGFGTVRRSVTVGESYKYDSYADEKMTTGVYTTTADNNVYGTLTTQNTIGESYNKLRTTGMDYEPYMVGRYTTDATEIDGFGTVLETITTGVSYKWDKHEAARMVTGAYTTVANNNAYGTLMTQITVGDSYNKIFNGTDYELYTVGTYSTYATADENELGQIDGYGTVLESKTIGQSRKLDVHAPQGEWDKDVDGDGNMDGKDVLTGAYTTTAQNNVSGILVTQETVGVSYNHKGRVVSLYTTNALGDNIDAFGTVLASETVGQSLKKDPISGEDIITGSYTTNAENDAYGTLTTQKTVGESFNKVWDKSKEEFVTYTVGLYTTNAVDIDRFGTVMETETIGVSLKDDPYNADVKLTTGSYTTIAQNNDYGTLTTQKTEGHSYNKIWDLDENDYVVYTVGAYTTDATDIDGFGTVLETETVGVSYKRDAYATTPEEKDFVSGRYTTTAQNDVYGILVSQLTTGDSYNKIAVGAGNYKIYKVGLYTTEAYRSRGDIDDEFGTVLRSVTVGESRKLDTYADQGEWDTDVDGDTVNDGKDVLTGSYTTVALNNAYGMLGTQVTAGKSFNHEMYVVGTYTTTATAREEGLGHIDGFGTVLETKTVGESHKEDPYSPTKEVITTGAYTTTAQNNGYGTLQTQDTIGVSYSRLGVDGEKYAVYTGDYTASYEDYIVGRYTTKARASEDDIDGFGTVLKTETVGESYKWDSVDKENMTTGMYTTLAQNSGYGTLTTQTTAGVSYAKIGWDGSNYVAYKGKAFGDYTTYIVGIYTTLATADAGDIDEFGTVRKTTTVGDSHKWDPNESEDMVTGAYTTTAQNNGYGTLLTQITVGESYNKVPIADGVYKKYTVGAYTTMATANSNALGKIDGFGTVRETITTGKSYKLDTHADKSEWDVWEDVSGDYTTIGKNIATGSYTTTATNTAAGVLFTQLTVGESYNKIFNGTGYEEYTVGRYTTLASAAENELGNIDGFGTVLKSITIGDSHKRDAITEKDIISGSYTTTAQNNAYGTLETQETIGESYNKVWNGSAYVVDTVGSYTTMTTADENELGFIDGFGTVRESITRGVSFKMDRFANDKMVSGYYSTTAWNNSYGTLMSQQTRGSSYNRLGVDAEGNFTAYNQERFNAGEYTSYSVGEYTTESYYSNTFTDASGQEQREVDGFGTVRRSVTVGESYKYDSYADEKMTTGVYTTTADNNVYGTLTTQNTIGESYNKLRTTGMDYEPYMVGRYTTDATEIDGFGTVLETITTGVSYKWDKHEAARMVTGAYTTVANNNAYGTLMTQITVGDSYNKIFNGTDYELYTVGTYSTYATADENELGQIDGYGTVLESKTIGQSRKLDVHAPQGEWDKDVDGDGNMDGKDVLTGAYTTTAQNNVSGILVTQETVGVSYNHKGRVVSLYTTNALGDNIDAFGTVLASETVGQSLKKDPISGEDIITGSYTTNAENDAYGTLTTQKTVGESFNKVWDKSKEEFVTYTVGLYTTNAVDIDRFGTVMETETIGVSLKDDPYNADVKLTTGSYTTIAQNNDYGTLTTQKTEGHSYNKIWDLDENDYVVYTVGAYTTDATDIDGFGTVLETETVGVSYKRDAYATTPEEKDFVSGRYTTTAQNDVYGILVSQLTTGDSYNKIAVGAGNYKIYKVGLYTTEAYRSRGDIDDEFGTVLRSVTVGESRKLDTYADQGEWDTDVDGDTVNDGKDVLTGSYTTVALNNAYGMLGTQVTAGKSFNHEMYVVGTYTTTATAREEGLGHIDGFGTVLETKTVGESHKEDPYSPTKEVITTGAYTTTAQNNGYGTLTSQETIGVSYNMVADGQGGYDLYTVGQYTTESYYSRTYEDAAGETQREIDGFGTVRKSQTVGESFKRDPVEWKKGNDVRLVTGGYTTTAENNSYGTLTTQQTVGESFNRITLDGTNYYTYVVGSYTTDAVAIDSFGTVQETLTVGESSKLDVNDENPNLDIDGDTVADGRDLVTGKYTTRALNNGYGILTTQKTIGESFNKIWNGSAYAVFTVGGYTTDATDIDKFGTVLETTTVGVSAKMIENEDGSIEDITTGRYTTTANNNGYGTLVSQETFGESYNKIPNGDGTYKMFTVGLYTTKAYESTGGIDGFGTVVKSQTVGISRKEDQVTGDTIISGKYTTTANNNGYGTLFSQGTFGVSYNHLNKVVGQYTTLTSFDGDVNADGNRDVDSFGTVLFTETVGISLKNDPYDGSSLTTGKYTTWAENNAYGTLVTQQTRGDSFNMIVYPNGDKERYIVGEYTTDATIVDGFGTVRKTVTVGGSYKKDPYSGARIVTGAYTTTAENNTYGTLTTQQTLGESYNKILEKDYDINGDGVVANDYVRLVVGAYTTDATNIDGFGTVLGTQTVGVSKKWDAKGKEWMTTGGYTTVAENDGYGTLQTQITVGVSYNKIAAGWDGEKYTYYESYIVGLYTTEAYSANGDIDDFGTVLSTRTIGESHKWDQVAGEDIVSGIYTTTAANNGYGTLIAQQTTGESYNKVPVGDGTYKIYTVGLYTTNATIIDGFGTVVKSETVGISRKEDSVTGEDIISGKYTTNAYNNGYGTLTTQTTDGVSYNHNQYVVGRYSTNTSYYEDKNSDGREDIDAFGTVSFSRTTVTERVTVPNWSISSACVVYTPTATLTNASSTTPSPSRSTPSSYTLL